MNLFLILFAITAIAVLLPLGAIAFLLWEMSYVAAVTEDLKQ